MTKSASSQPGPTDLHRRKALKTIARPILAASTAPEKDHASVFKYDNSRFTGADPALLTYEEITPLKLPLTKSQALCSMPGDHIAVGGDEKLVVLDAKGTPVKSIELDAPATAVAAGPDGTLYAALKTYVSVFDSSGGHVADWATLGERSLITCLVVSGNRVYMADAGQRMVFVFDTDGRMKGQIGQKDKSKDVPGFVVPSPFFDMAADPDGGVWIVNPGYLRVEKYTPDGARVSHWGKHSMKIEGFCGCCNPSHLARRADGSFITSEKGMARIKVYDREGQLSAVVALPRHFKQETRAHDVAVDSNNRILVLDKADKTVRIFVEKERP